MLDLDMALRVFLLAIFQGIAEFLPISSSGHLLVLGRLMELPDVFLLTILLHLGTLLSVLVFFARELARVCLRQPRALALVIVGTIPTVAIAFSIQHFLPWFETSRLTTGVCFLITALLLFTILRSSCRTEEEEYMMRIAYQDEGLIPPEQKTIETTTWLDVIIIGIAQGFAVFPGISRSGSTIATGTFLQLKSKWAAEFSFYLSIPVIAGGAILELLKQFKKVGATDVASFFQADDKFIIYLLGAGVSFIVGWISLYYLMQLLKAGKLHRFAYYLLIAGVLTIGWTCYDHLDIIMQWLGQAPATEVPA